MPLCPHCGIEHVWGTPHRAPGEGIDHGVIVPRDGESWTLACRACGREVIFSMPGYRLDAADDDRPRHGRFAHPAFHQVAHRPWPPPPRSWSMEMAWEDLLFAHWAVKPDLVRRLVPDSLELDVHDGRAWVGVVPFRMSGVRLRFLPEMPGTSAFPELNLRTYVRRGDRPGVWFFSLDAASAVAVRAARTWFHLPYFDAEMSSAREGDDVVYRSRRTHRNASEAEFEARYGPAGGPLAAGRGSLEEFLTARYCLYSVDAHGRPLRGEIQHVRWPLEKAHAQFGRNTVAAAAGLDLRGEPDHLAFARRLDVVAWTPTRAG